MLRQVVGGAVSTGVRGEAGAEGGGEDKVDRRQGGEEVGEGE